jgi:hypothetical protein
VHELLLQERVEPAGRLVQHQQLRLVHERLHDADLLPVALRQALDLPVEVEAEVVGEAGDPAGGDAAAQTPQVFQELAGGLPAVHDEVAGQIADPPAQGDAVGPRVEPEHPDVAGGGPDQVEQDADGGGLAGAVGAQEAVHLTGPDLQVEAGQAAVAAAVGLGQCVGGDGRVSHRRVLSRSGIAG